jgi:hypothetical protein
MIDEVEIPVRCPKCGAVELNKFPDLVVVVALTVWKQMRLYTSCHDSSWDASAPEIQSIREHVGDEWLESQRQRFAAQARPG